MLSRDFFARLARPRVVRAALVLVASTAILLGGLAGGSSATGDPTLASGTLNAGQGVNVQSVSVHAYSDPGDDNGTLTDVGSTSTDSSGTWTLAVPITSDMTDLAASNGGYVNFVLVASSANGYGITHVTRLLSNGQWIDTSEPTSLGSPAIPFASYAVGPNWPCIPQITVIATEDQYSAIGELHVAHDSTGTYTYGTHADSNFDVGISYDGNHWSLSGSYHVGNDKGAQISYTEGPDFGHRLTSQFHNLKRKYNWFGYQGCGPAYDTYPSRWNGGAQIGLDNSYLDFNCNTSSGNTQNFGRNTSFDRSSSHAYHLSSAINLFGIVQVGVDSGYSQYVISHWSFGSGQSNHYLCGNDGPVTTAHRIFAGIPG